MQISIKSFAIAFALIWGGGIACASLIHLAIPSYATVFLAFVSSIYPGFHGAQSFADALVGIAYGVLDGGFGGLIFAWLYNQFLSKTRPSAV